METCPLGIISFVFSVTYSIALGLSSMPSGWRKWGHSDKVNLEFLCIVEIAYIEIWGVPKLLIDP